MSTAMNIKYILIASFIAVSATVAGAVGYEASDPISFIPDARVLALGKANTALANETASIYSNPAGLAESEGWEWSSMSGKLLDEYNYFSFAGLYATQNGTIGLGYTGTSITGGIPTRVSEASSPSDPIYLVDESRSLMGYSNNAFTLSYGKELNERLSLGASVKLLSTSLYGGDITNGNGSGSEIDLGLKYHPEQKWLTLGLVAKNISNGQLTYANGHSEEYPEVITLGAAVELQAVKLALDLESNPSLGLPIVARLGGEWAVDPRVSLRAGFSPETDLTFGVGLKLAGYRFDYAYVPVAGITGSGSNYFSLAYAFDPEKPAPAQPAEIIKFKTFPDVPSTYWAYKPIILLATADLITGYPNGLFVPEGEITRAELCTLLMKTRVEGLGGQTYASFPDVPEQHWAAKYVAQAAELGIIKGYEDGNFKPKNQVTRAEGLAMIARYAGIQEEAYLGQFGDIQSSHWAARTIAGAQRAGVLNFLSQRPFQPNRSLTRAEAAEMLYQSKPALIPLKYRGII